MWNLLTILIHKINDFLNDNLGQNPFLRPRSGWPNLVKSRGKQIWYKHVLDVKFSGPHFSKKIFKKVILALIIVNRNQRFPIYKKKSLLFAQKSKIDQNTVSENRKISLSCDCKFIKPGKGQKRSNSIWVVTDFLQVFFCKNPHSLPLILLIKIFTY